MTLYRYLQAPAGQGQTSSERQKLPQWFLALSQQVQARFVIEGSNIVFRGFPPRDRSRWFVPAGLRRALIAAHHRGSHGAHMGISKTASRLALRYYWPKMFETAKGFVKACERCQRAKAAPRIPITSRMLNRESLWSTVAFDFFGPLPRTQKGNLYILVGIDHFSRWPEAVAVRVATAEVVAEFFHARIIAQHGTPKELLTDHGSHFASQVISKLCSKYKVRRLMSTPYTPQGNGIVERFMGYLKNSLITLIDNHPTRWDAFLPAILFAYRATPHPETGDSPFFLNKGYDPVIPEMLTIGAPSDPTLGNESWLVKLEAARKNLEVKIAEGQERIRRAIQHQESTQYQPGQIVLVKKTPPEMQKAGTKLTDKFDHPARILSLMPNGVTYRISFLRDSNQAIVNRRNLRPFYELDSDNDDDVLSAARFPVASLISAGDK